MSELFPEIEEPKVSSLFPEVETGLFPEVEEAPEVELAPGELPDIFPQPVQAFKEPLEKAATIAARKFLGPLEEAFVIGNHPLTKIIQAVGIKIGVRATKDQLESLLGPTAARGLENVAVGMAGTVSAMGGAARLVGAESIGETISRNANIVASEFEPPDPKLPDRIAQGFGSSVVFMIPGYGVQAGAARLAIAGPSLAAWMGAGTSATIEAMVEAGGTYNEVLARDPEAKDEAVVAANKVFALNMPLLLITNKLGFFGEQGAALRQAMVTSLSEGTQELFQEMIGNFALHDPIMQNTLDSFLVGAVVGPVLGGGVSALRQTSQTAPREGAEPQEAPPEVPPVKLTTESPEAIQAKAFDAPGTDIGGKEVFTEIKKLADDARVKNVLSADQGAFIDKMDEFWRRNPEAASGVVQGDGTIQPVAKEEVAPPELEEFLTPEESESELDHSIETPGNLAFMPAEEFARRFPGVDPSIHRGAVAAGLENGKDTSDANQKAYPELFQPEEMAGVREGPTEEEVALNGRRKEDVMRGVADELDQLAIPFDTTGMEGSGIAEEFRTKGFIDFRGQKAENARQVAEMAAVFRNPKVENFQVTFTKGGKVVGHQVMSSGMPDFFSISVRTRTRMISAANRLQADGVWFAHNHPSGNPNPSGKDIAATKRFAKRFGKRFRGHIVTDDIEFGVISSKGKVRFSKFRKPLTRFREPGLKLIKTTDAAATISRDFSKGNIISVVFIDTKGRVIVVESIGLKANVQEFIKQGLRHHGSRAAIVVHPFGWESSFKTKYPSRVLDILGMRPDGTVATSKASRDPSAFKKLLEPPPDIEMFSERPGFYRIQETPENPYTPDEFQALVFKKGIKLGDDLTLRRAIVDPVLKNGRLTKGTKVRLVAIDKEGEFLLVQELEKTGQYTTAGPRDFAETFEPEETRPKPSEVKKRIMEATGLKKPEPTILLNELQALAIKLQAMEKGAKFGFRDGVRKTRDKLLASKSDMETRRRQVIDYAEKNIPGAEIKKRFLKIVQKVKTEKSLNRALVTIDNEAAKVHKRKLIKDVIVTTKRAIKSPSVSVEAKERITSLLKDISLSKPTEKTKEKAQKTRDWMEREIAAGRDVELPDRILKKLDLVARTPLADMDELALEALTTDLRRFTEMGKNWHRVKKEEWKLRMGNIMREILPELEPLERFELIRAAQGEKNLTTGENFWNIILQGSNVAQEVNLIRYPIDVLFTRMTKSKDYTSSFYKHFKKEFDWVWGLYKNRTYETINKMRDFARSLGLSKLDFERIGIYAIRVQKNGRQHLIEGNKMTAEKVDSIVLNEKEMKFYKEMRRVLEELHPQVRRLIIRLYDRDVGSVANYSPFHTEYAAMSTVEVQARYGDLDFQKRLSGEEQQSFTLERANQANQPLKVHAMEVFEKHIDDVFYLLETQETVKMLHEIARTPQYQEAAGKLGAEIMIKWTDLMAKNGGGYSDTPGFSLDTVRKNVTFTLIGLKLSSALIQPLAIGQAAAMIGGKWAGKGSFAVLLGPQKKQWGQFFLKIPEVRERIGDDIALQNVSDIGYLKATQKASVYPLMYLDQVAATSTWAGAYMKALDEMALPLDLKNPNKEAIEFANLVLRRTQNSTFAKDRMLGLSMGGLNKKTSFYRTLFALQGFSLNEASFIEEDIILKNFRKGDFASMGASLGYIAITKFAEIEVRAFSRLAIAGTLFGVGLRAFPPEEERDPLFKRYIFELMHTIPYVGQLSSIVKYRSTGVPMLDAMRKAVMGPVQAIYGKEDSSKLRGIVTGLEALLGMAGLPVSEVPKIIRLIARGNEMRFPYSRELKELGEARKEGELTPGESERFASLKVAKRRFEIFRKRYTSARDRGDPKSAKEQVNLAVESMRPFRR